MIRVIHTCIYVYVYKRDQQGMERSVHAGLIIRHEDVHTNLTSHRIRINLTHVRARVVRLDVGHVQFPRVMSIVSDRQPWVWSDHVRMNGQDSFRIGLHPGDLHNTITGHEHSRSFSSRL